MSKQHVDQISSSLAQQLAQAVCGDDHLMCTWPGCGCKSTKRKINAVCLVVATEIGRIKSQVTAAKAEIDRLRAALQSCPCPGGGWTGIPDGMEPTVGNCMAHDGCGCVYGDVLHPGEQQTRETK